MLILIDGYNLIAPIAPPGRGSSRHWLQDERHRLIDRLADALGAELAKQTTVVFDAAAAPPGLESRYVQRGLEIEFAVGYPEADDRLEELIAAHTSPKRLTVVSSDHRIQNAARRRGATAIDSEQWLDRLADGEVMLAIRVARPASDAPPRQHDKAETPGEIAKWLSAFECEDELPPADVFENPFPPGYGEDLL